MKTILTVAFILLTVNAWGGNKVYGPYFVSDLIIAENNGTIHANNESYIDDNDTVHLLKDSKEMIRIDHEGNIASISDDYVRQIGEMGRFCEVYGHVWGYPYPTEVYVYYADMPRTRICKVCGKEETEIPARWEE